MAFPSRDWANLTLLNEEEQAVADHIIAEHKGDYPNSPLDYTDWEEIDCKIRSALKIPAFAPYKMRG